ncbi:tetratricopeptide repeat protein [Neolewinella antarctica]|uniref:Tetratricopeptide repeat protein n=1 Tax=Neolewinella antarctica TaxID=442734 RepID=A0ABX0XEY3_9BACT|nr:hypothetical protein [Neolewinella antarctica]NJC27777.1 hypothetical protein [Neolewinella antarctica]
MRTQQGQHLAKLTRYYAGFRTSFLRWATKTFRQPEDACLANYRRALIAWYEATIRTTDPYAGETDDFVKAMVGYYFNPQPIQTSLAGNAMPVGDDLAMGTHERPLHYIPLPIRLSARQQQMLASFQQLEKRPREVLLMDNYHRIDRARMAQIMDAPGGLTELENEINEYRLLTHKSWAAMGITEAEQIPSPADDELVEAYFTNQLETTERWALEARLPTDSVLREAVALREDWTEVLTVAGRQDLMELLQREEERTTSTGQSTDPKTIRPPTKDVQLSRRRTWLADLRLPTLPTVLAIMLIAAFAYLAYGTFGPAAPDRRAVANFEPFPNIFARLDPKDEDERDLQRILYYYDRGDYATTYDELLPVADAYPAAPLYLGVSALALEQPSRALEWFDRIPASDYYHPFAEWYEALAYLAEGREEAASTTLRDIVAQPDHPYRAQAEAVLAR